MRPLTVYRRRGTLVQVGGILAISPPSSTAASCFTDSLTRLDFLKLDSACWDFRDASESFAASALSIAAQTKLPLSSSSMRRIPSIGSPFSIFSARLVPAKTLTTLSIFFLRFFFFVPFSERKKIGGKIDSTIGNGWGRIGRVATINR